MRICITYSPWLLSHRGGLDLDGYRDDPRGLSGSEMCAVRVMEELSNGGLSGAPQVLLYTKSNSGHHRVRPWEERGKYEWDVAISINCPDDLRGMRAKVKVAYCLLNDFSFAKAGFEEHVDLFVSPSQAHLDQCLHTESWRKVEVSPQHPDGKAQWDPSSKPWAVVPLGCDPERYEGFTKVPGRVVYCSSPDRGLHLLLQEWPAIKRAAPHATLRIFYRLEPWLRGFDQTPYYPPVEPLRARALYVEEALRRMSGPEWGITVMDSVSRATIEREMAEAEVMAYPCSVVNSFTEGFSCSTLESCAARACPVIMATDALGSIYGEALTVKDERGQGRFTNCQPWYPGATDRVLACWRGAVIRSLTDEQYRNQINDQARALARSMTWKHTAQKLMAAIAPHL